MQFEYTPPQTEVEAAFGGYFTINIFGRIGPDDDALFQEFLAQIDVPPRTHVYIDSLGGDVEAAINIGRIIRDHWFSTHVGQYLIDHADAGQFIKKRKMIPGRCMSAATLIFLGGRLRYMAEASKFGVHQFSFQDPSPDHIGRSQILSAKIARYVADMGISAGFLAVSSAAAGNQINILSSDDLQNLGVVTGGQTAVTWSIQAADNVLYVRGERDNLYGHHKMLLGFTKPGSFFVQAVIESQGREDELTLFPLVELVVEHSEGIVVDLNGRCDRRVNGIYTNISAPISETEAKVVAYSDAFGIRVRGGPDAPMFLGVGPMSTVGGTHMLQSFVHNLS